MFPYNPNIPAILNLAAPAVQHPNQPVNNPAQAAGGQPVQAAAQIGAQLVVNVGEPDAFLLGLPALNVPVPQVALNPANATLVNGFFNPLQAPVPAAAALQGMNSPDSGTSAQTAMHQSPR